MKSAGSLNKRTGQTRWLIKHKSEWVSVDSRLEILQWYSSTSFTCTLINLHSTNVICTEHPVSKLDRPFTTASCYLMSPTHRSRLSLWSNISLSLHARNPPVLTALALLARCEFDSGVPRLLSLASLVLITLSLAACRSSPIGLCTLTLSIFQTVIQHNQHLASWKVIPFVNNFVFFVLL